MYIADYECEPGWEFFDMSCYKISEDVKNYTSAENDCIQEGGHLTSIHSKEENDFLLRLIGPLDFPDPIIIVGGKVKNDESFYWTDESEFDYSDWSPGQPFGTEACFGIQLGFPPGHGSWSIDPCFHPHKFICKKPFGGNCYMLYLEYIDHP